jgi:hypothetical protein
MRVSIKTAWLTPEGRKMGCVEVNVKNPTKTSRAKRILGDIFSYNSSQGFKIALNIRKMRAVIRITNDVDGGLVYSSFEDLVCLAFFALNERPEHLYSSAFAVSYIVRCEPNPVLEVKSRHMTEQDNDPLGRAFAAMIDRDLKLLGELQYNN